MTETITRYIETARDSECKRFGTCQAVRRPPHTAGGYVVMLTCSNCIPSNYLHAEAPAND